MRGFGAFLIAFFIASFSSASEADLVDLYQKNGILAVQNRLDNMLASKAFWSEKIANIDVKYGYYEKPHFVVVVDKTAKSFELFKISQEIQSLIAADAITGLNGDKWAEGDLKTPVGAYEITRTFEPSDPFYGPLAFSLSYPNLLDIMQKKSGGGIWIHGFPLNGARDDDFNTKGCVAIDNDLLKKMGEITSGDGGITLINESGKMTASKDEIALILAKIWAWKQAWQGDSASDYLAFYADDFRRFDGMHLKEFSEMKRSIFARKERKIISFSDFIISPYPNTKDERLFRVSFWEDYNSDSGYKFSGRKTVYVRLVGDDMKIIIEQ